MTASNNPSGATGALDALRTAGLECCTAISRCRSECAAALAGAPADVREACMTALNQCEQTAATFRNIAGAPGAAAQQAAPAGRNPRAS